MKAALAIAAAEVRGLSLALLGALLSGALGHVIIIGWAFGRSGPSIEQLAVVAATCVTCVQLVLAAVLGGGAVSRDLADRRLGFYLARPVSGVAYWGAKIVPAFLVAYAAGWLVLVPGFVLGSATRQLAVLSQVTREWSVSTGLAATALAVALAAAAAGAVRARSGLLMLDVVLLLVTAVALIGVMVASWEGGSADVLLASGLPWLPRAAFVLLLAGSAAQIALGRLDLRRGHLWLSAILWTGLLACILGLALLSKAVTDVAAEDLRLRAFPPVEAPAAGAPVLLAGSDDRWQGHVAAFFLDADGRFSPRRSAWDSGHAWSADGRLFVWSQGAFPFFEEPLWQTKPFHGLSGFTPSLWAMDFTTGGAAPRLIARRPGGPEFVRALSPDGSRVLIERYRTKLVVATDDGRTLASLAQPSGWTDARFVSDTTLRAMRWGPSQSRIVEWDFATGRLVERGAIALEGDRGTAARLIPTHDFQGVLRFDGTGLFLHDLDGKQVATLVDGWQAGARTFRSAGLFSRGRFGAIERVHHGWRLRVFDAGGRALLDTPVDQAGVGGEIAPGVLVLGRARSTVKTTESVFVDLATGAVVRREAGLYPAVNTWTGWRGAPVEPGSLATRLFHDGDDESLVLVDIKTGTRKVLVRRRAS